MNAYPKRYQVETYPIHVLQWMKQKWDSYHASLVEQQPDKQIELGDHMPHKE